MASYTWSKCKHCDGQGVMFAWIKGRLEYVGFCGACQGMGIACDQVRAQ